MLAKIALGIALIVAAMVLWRFVIGNFRQGIARAAFGTIYRRNERPFNFWFLTIAYFVWVYGLAAIAITTLSSLFL
jgi:hypothetical protein